MFTFHVFTTSARGQYCTQEEKDVSEEKRKRAKKEKRISCERAEKEGVDRVKDVSKTRQGE